MFLSSLASFECTLFSDASDDDLLQRNEGPLKKVKQIKYMIMCGSDWSCAYFMFALPKWLQMAPFTVSLMSS